MDLPVMPPVSPMLARPSATIPPGMQYEGKWDGFRAILFKDGDEIVIGSRNEKPLTRYFPEVVRHARAALPERCVLDGEIVIVTGTGLDFEALLNRIHPAQSRVERLAAETPADFVAFDLLALGNADLMNQPLRLRRAQLETVVKPDAVGVHLAPATLDLAVARDWFARYEGAGLDGVVAKSLDEPYRAGQRAMTKIKHQRTADCVVAGFRWYRDADVVGSMLLGLYDDAGVLQHVGVVGAFPMTMRRSLVAELEPYRAASANHPWSRHESDGDRGRQGRDAGRRPGGETRWNAGKQLSWEPLRPELVCEVAYDHLQGSRFRHTAQWRRWRTDRDPRSCTYEQLAVPTDFDVAAVLDSGTRP